MMADHKFEHDTREARKSLNDAQSAAVDEYTTGVDLFRKGLERTVKVQKQMLELASQQNAETIDLWRTMFRDFPAAEPILKFTEQTIENFIGAHRRYLDIAEGTTNDMAESAKTQGAETARAAQEMTQSTTSQRERPKAA
jgi:hypothetical protein